jgi:hypothetical protein
LEWFFAVLAMAGRSSKHQSPSSRETPNSKLKSAQEQACFRGGMALHQVASGMAEIGLDFWRLALGPLASHDSIENSAEPNWGRCCGHGVLISSRQARAVHRTGLVSKN